MGDRPRSIERKGKPKAREFLSAAGLETKWLSETSADAACRPSKPAKGPGALPDRFLRIQLKYNTKSFDNWLRYLKSSINSDRQKYHDMFILAMSTSMPGKACLVDVHQAREIQSADFHPESWTSAKEIGKQLRDAYGGGRGHTCAQLEYTTITSATRLVEQVTRQQFWKKLEHSKLTPKGTNGTEYGPADYFLHVKGRRKPLRVQEKVLKVKKKNGKDLGLRADLVRSGGTPYLATDADLMTLHARASTTSTDPVLHSTIVLGFDELAARKLIPRTARSTEWKTVLNVYPDCPGVLRPRAHEWYTDSLSRCSSTDFADEIYKAIQMKKMRS